MKTVASIISGIALSLALVPLTASATVNCKAEPKAAACKKAAVRKAKDVFNAAEKEGLMILQAGPDVVRFAPSLVIDDADIDEGLDRLERAVAKLTRG